MLMFDSRLSEATATKLHDLYLCFMRDPLFRQLFSMAMLTGTWTRGHAVCHMLRIQVACTDPHSPPMIAAQSSRGACSRLVALTSGTVADRVCPAFPTIIEDRRYGIGLEEYGPQTLTVHALAVPSVVFRLSKCCGLLETITDSLLVRK